jgi:hypothetical protein
MCPDHHRTNNSIVTPIITDFKGNKLERTRTTNVLYCLGQKTQARKVVVSDLIHLHRQRVVVIRNETWPLRGKTLSMVGLQIKLRLNSLYFLSANLDVSPTTP